jgi:hypothetical protein
MDPLPPILLEALRIAATDGGELRLYRSGKLPGLLPARTAACAAAAAQALRDGLIEIVRTETRGKTTTEFVRITPRGVDCVVQHDSPVRAMDALREALQLNAQNVPAWLTSLRQELDALSQRTLDEVTRIGRRLDRLAEQVEAALRKAAEQGRPAAAPWTQAALDFLAGRHRTTGQTRCPLPELFAALEARQVVLNIKEFHAGLRRLQDAGFVQLLPPDEEPPQPEYALPDGTAVLYHVALVLGAGEVSLESSR